MISPWAIYLIVLFVCLWLIVISAAIEHLTKKLKGMRHRGICQYCDKDGGLPVFLMGTAKLQKFLRLYPNRYGHESYHLSCLRRLFRFAGEPDD